MYNTNGNFTGGFINVSEGQSSALDLLAVAVREDRTSLASKLGVNPRKETDDVLGRAANNGLEIHKADFSSGELRTERFLPNQERPAAKWVLYVMQDHDSWFIVTSRPGEGKLFLQLHGVLHRFLLARSIPICKFMRCLFHNSFELPHMAVAKNHLCCLHDLAWKEELLFRLLFEMTGDAACLPTFQDGEFEAACLKQQAYEHHIDQRITNVNKLLNSEKDLTRQHYTHVAMLITSFNRGAALKCMDEEWVAAFSQILEQNLPEKYRQGDSWPFLQRVDRYRSRSLESKIWHRLLEALVPEWMQTLIPHLFGHSFIYLQCGPFEGTLAVARGWCDPFNKYGPLLPASAMPAVNLDDQSTIVAERLSGKLGSVRECEVNGLPCVVKVCNLDALAMTGDDLESELYHHRRLAELCPEIVPRFLGVTIVGSNLYYYQERGQDVFEVIQNGVPQFAAALSTQNPTAYVPNEWEERVRSWYTQALRGIRAMRDVARVCHRDVKLENFVLVGNSLRFIDFGCMRQFPVYEQDMLCARSCGTVTYMSPETFHFGKSKEGLNIPSHCWRGHRNEVHCLGVCLFMWLFALPPWKQGPVRDEKRWVYATGGKYLKHLPRNPNCNLRHILRMWSVGKTSVRCIDFATPQIIDHIQLCLLPEEQRWNADELLFDLENGNMPSPHV